VNKIFYLSRWELKKTKYLTPFRLFWLAWFALGEQPTLRGLGHFLCLLGDCFVLGAKLFRVQIVQEARLGLGSHIRYFRFFFRFGLFVFGSGLQCCVLWRFCGLRWFGLGAAERLGFSGRERLLFCGLWNGWFFFW
jgi:hypothetical protein